MVQHFNFGTKTEVNPFENVKFVKLGSCGHHTEGLHRMLNKQSEEVTTRKINDNWVILYNVELLDFTTIIKWMTPDRGTFQMRGKSNHHYVNIHTLHFLIEEDIMSIW